MYPVPPRVHALLAQPLQGLAASSAVGLLRLTGLWAVAEGNVIVVDDHPLDVAVACNGLSMLVALSATVTAFAALFPAPAWRKGVVLASVVPLALGSNVLRIAATAWCYQRFGAEVGGRLAHDAAGWLMTPVALAMVEVKPTLLGRPIVRAGRSG
jgi:exosortase